MIKKKAYSPNSAKCVFYRIRGFEKRDTDQVWEVITEHFTKHGINPETQTVVPLSCGQAKALAFIVGVGGTEKLTGSEKTFYQTKRVLFQS